MSDETDLDILNNSMDTMVEQFPEELLPVAVMLTARLVCCSHFTWHCCILTCMSSASLICALRERQLFKTI